MMNIPRHDPLHVWRGKKRFYVTPGGTLPGVTTILGETKPDSERASLEKWKAENPNNTEGIDRGNWLHSQVEAFLKNGTEPAEDSTYIGFWQSVKPVLETVELPILVESAVWVHNQYAGTLDCLAVCDGMLTLFDWKTSGKPKEEAYVLDYMIQAGAYANAVNWMYGEFYGLEVSQAKIVVALNDQKAQVFVLSSNELESMRHAFFLRMREFMQASHH